MARIWIPLPDRGFDVTETAVPWKLAVDAGHDVVFATEAGGSAPAADPRLFGPVVFGKLGAEAQPKAFYAEMAESSAFQAPLSWATLDPARFDGLILPGGHSPPMKQYLESESLQAKVVEFWRLGRPVGAICHGLVVLARARDADTGHSVIHERKTTCLPKYMERLAYLMTFWKLGKYYRTYPEYVQDEVKRALANPREQFQRGPVNLGKHGTPDDDAPAFVVEDGNLVSARWPGDAYLFARRFLAQVEAAAAVRAA